MVSLSSSTVTWSANYDPLHHSPITAESLPDLDLDRDLELFILSVDCRFLPDNGRGEICDFGALA